ncbi:PUA-like domain-containing protein [Astrocystis sublimbata]|nr:PUA-like domain-containing protein [Astrocystis sublimbata]
MPKRKAAQQEPEAEASSTPRRSTRLKPTCPHGHVIPPPSKATSKRAPKPKQQWVTVHESELVPKIPSKPAVGGATSSASKRSYWLMKAEPESRFENGVDVKFSIDDLASKTEPEPWDGIRAYPARNNLRAMKKGDLAFFYHSNFSAHDPNAPYYDPSSKPEDPKWSVVHVEFRSKFNEPIGLKELRELGQPGEPLANMQMLKQSRLSVSRVTQSQWQHLTDLVQEHGGVEMDLAKK